MSPTRVLLPFALCALGLHHGAAAPLPNIVVIIADDLGWADVGYNNPSSVHTPHIDALAAGGVRFDQHYVMSQCTPTRVALFTGRYPARAGRQAQQANNAQAFAHGTLTLSSMLAEAGYESFMSGKWHLGSAPEWGPNEHGFDSSHGSLAGAVGMYDHRYRPGDTWEITWHRDHEIIPGYENGVHATDLTSLEAVRFIQKGRDRPFFLYLPYHAPHTPLDERGPFVDRPTQRDPADNSRWLDEDEIPWFNDPEGKIQSEPDPEKRLLLATVYHLDHSIGEVVKALEETGQRENTIIFFSSDNGPQVNWSGNAYPDDLNLTDFNQPDDLRGSKTDVYEGGIKVAGFVNWPARIAPRIVAEPVHIVDWLPTVAGMIGYTPATDPMWDGEDLAPLIDGTGTLGERTFYWLWNSNSNRWALRHGDWKIVRYGSEPTASTDWQLFNLIDDPDESDNVAAANAAKRDELHTLFLAERAKDFDGNMVSPRLRGPPSADGPFTATLSFNTSVSGIQLSEVQVAGGTATALTGSGTNYSITVTPTLGEAGEIEIYLPGDIAVAADGRPSTPTNRLVVDFDPDGVGEPGDLPFEPLGRGVAGRESATGPGYLMYSRESIHTRFAASPPNPFQADHFVAVRFTGGVWTYDNNQNNAAANDIPFTPAADDLLLADLNFDQNTASLLVGTEGSAGGIASGYASGDLVVLADRWNGGTNTNEYDLEGSYLIRNDGTVIGVAPGTVELSVSLHAPWATRANPYIVDIEFNVPVTGLTATDLVVTNGAISSFEGGDTSYRATVIPAAPGAVTVSLIEDAVAEGNPLADPAVTYWKGYELWANGMLADPLDPARRLQVSNVDRDLRSNLEEYLFGGLPELADLLPGFSIAEPGAGGVVELSAPERAEGALYELRYGTDLKRWFTVGQDLGGISNPPSGLQATDLGSTPIQRHPHWGDYDLRSRRIELDGGGETPAELLFRHRGTAP